MKKDITIEVLDEIEKHCNFKDYDIFNLLHERINVFDKYVIENCLVKKLDEVLLDLYLPSFFSSEKNIFRVLSHLYFLDLFIEFLQFRCDFDNVFLQKQQILSPKNLQRIIEVSIKDFTILNNLFFTSQSFYFYGRIESFVNSEPLQHDFVKNHLYIRGMEGGTINVFDTLIGINYNDSNPRDLDYILCLFYGTVSFDTNLMENVITANRIYTLETMNEQD
jgi:hypothetical protein